MTAKQVFVAWKSEAVKKHCQKSMGIAMEWPEDWAEQEFDEGGPDAYSWAQNLTMHELLQYRDQIAHLLPSS